MHGFHRKEEQDRIHFRTFFQVARTRKGRKVSLGALLLIDESISVVIRNIVSSWCFFNSPYCAQSPDWENIHGKSGRSLSVANYCSSRDGQLVQASAVTLPAARIQVCKLGSYLRSSFTGCVTIQRIMAALLVVELFKAEKLVLQVASCQKGYEVEVLSSDSPDQSFHKRVRDRQVGHSFYFVHLEYS